MNAAAEQWAGPELAPALEVPPTLSTLTSWGAVDVLESQAGSSLDS